MSRRSLTQRTSRAAKSAPEQRDRARSTENGVLERLHRNPDGSPLGIRGTLPIPPGFLAPDEKLANTYAMRVKGNCLSPVIRDGDAVVLSASRTPVAGDFVLIYLKNKMPPIVKRLAIGLMFSRPGEYKPRPVDGIMPVAVVETLTPPDCYTIDFDKIAFMHVAIGVVRKAGGFRAFSRR